MINPIKCLLIIDEAHTHFFVYLSGSFYYRSELKNSISCSYAFSKTQLTVWQMALNDWSDSGTNQM